MFSEDEVSEDFDPNAEAPLPNAPLPLPKAPPPDAPPPNEPDEPKADGPVLAKAPKPVAGFTGPAPNVPNVELEVAPPDGCCCVFAPKDPNIELLPVLDLDASPPPPRDKPPKPVSVSVSAAMLSSVDDVMSTEIVGVLIAGAEGADVVGCGCCGCCCPKPNDELPNAGVAPENALNPNEPVDVPEEFCGEVEPKGLFATGGEVDAKGLAAAGEAPKALCCGVVCTGAEVGVLADDTDAETMPG